MDLLKPIEILLVEDSPADIRLTEEALKENKIKVNLHVVKDGVEALEYLRKEKGYAHSVLPDLILLDLNLPRKDGREVLKEIKEDPILHLIPVVILTMSKNEEDILLTYKYHANCYITKPLDFNKFIDVVKKISNFWFTVVRLPERNHD